MGAGGTLTIAGTIAGAKAFEVTGAGGTLNLNGANNYSATTNISIGTVKLGNATGLGTTAAGTTVSSGAALDLNGQAVLEEALSLAGTGVSAGGALTNTKDLPVL